MKTVKGSFGKAASSVAALDPIVVLTLASTACIFTAYQPDVPETLQ